MLFVKVMSREILRALSCLAIRNDGVLVHVPASGDRKAYTYMRLEDKAPERPNRAPKSDPQKQKRAEKARERITKSLKNAGYSPEQIDYYMRSAEEGEKFNSANLKFGESQPSPSEMRIRNALKKTKMTPAEIEVHIADITGRDIKRL